MLHRVLHSAAAIVSGWLLSAVLFGLAVGHAAPVNCPDEIVKLKPANGDLFVASSQNLVQRIRAGEGAVQQTVKLKPDAHIVFYYFAAPQSLQSPMVFALVRAYRTRSGYSTSLDPDVVHVSNSDSSDEAVPTKNYVYFHEEKRRGLNVLREAFHMWFHDGPFSRANSYDDLDDPDVYALPGGKNFTGFKAYMQRISAFPADGRCVVFDLFRRKRFADSLQSFSATLIALADKRSSVSDQLKFEVEFAPAP